MRWLTCVVFLVVSGILVGCPQPSRPDDELSLTGHDWDLVGAWTGRIQIPGLVGSNEVACAFTETEFEWSEAQPNGTQVVWRGIYGVDTSSNPNRIDLVPTSISPYNRNLQGYLLVGVYEIDKSRPSRWTLKLTYVKAADDPRPLSVETGPVLLDVDLLLSPKQQAPVNSMMGLGM